MYKVPFSYRTVLFIFFAVVLSAQTGFAAYLRNVPQTVTQPDGTVIKCYATGDEFYNWLHDKDGYTIIQDENGYYVYAIRNNGELVSSGILAGQDYSSKAEKMGVLNQQGLEPGINLSPEEIGKIRRQKAEEMQVPEPDMVPEPTSQIEGVQDKAATVSQAPNTGTMNNIVIFIRFADQSEFTDTVASYDGAFNTNTVSMKKYFEEASYNQLSISSTFYPQSSTSTVVSYQDPHSRDYFRQYSVTNPTGYLGDTQRREREHQLLVDAVNAVATDIPNGLDVDGDNDGKVDNVAFIIQGATEGWSSLLWPHRWALYTYDAFINGKQVWDYNFQLSEYMAEDDHFGVGVLSHEMFHSLGAPDLYHYSQDSIEPVGKWDVMEWTTTVPQHMLAYMKFRYGGWISEIPEITTPGTYLLNPLSTLATGNCYKIASPNSPTEYFVVEYRNTAMGTFDQDLPGTGLLVYRINSSVDGEGNRNGPPDEVYIFRPDGTVTVNGTHTQAHFSQQTGRTTINSSSNPYPFLSDGTAGGLDISNIGFAGSTISFDYNVPVREIAVFENGTNIPDGTDVTVNFGIARPGTPVLKTFTIINSGYEELSISNLSLPQGFSLIGDFPAVISPYGTETFQVQLDAGSLGAYLGSLTFNNNDLDENPFNFPISGTVVHAQEVQLDLTTDGYGEETTWDLVDSQDNVVYSGGPYDSNQSFSVSMMLSEGDYQFTIYDDYGDGICCAYGNGSYSLTNMTTGEVYVTGGSFADYETTPFSIAIDSRGDINNDGVVDLKDAILTLQVCGGFTPSMSVFTDGDVDGDDRIGIPEAIYVQEKVSQE